MDSYSIIVQGQVVHLRTYLFLLMDISEYIRDFGNTRRIKENFFRRACIAVFLVNIPLVVYTVFWGSTTTATISVSSQFFLLFNLFLIRRGKVEIAVALSAVLSYTALALVPYHSGPIRSSLLDIAGVYLVIHYTTQLKFVRIINGILAGIAFFCHELLFAFSEYTPFPSVLIVDLMIGTLALVMIAITMFFYDREIVVYRQKERQIVDFLHKISEVNPFMIFTKDLNQKYSYVNQSFEEVLGLRKEDIIGKTTRELSLQYADLASIEKTDEEVLLQGTSKVMSQQKVIDHRGIERHLEVIKSPIYDEDQKISAILSVAIDVTDRKERDRQLAESLSLLSSTLESTADGILASDLHGRVTIFNQRFLEKWRLPPIQTTEECEELLLKVMDQLSDPEGFAERLHEIHAQTNLSVSDMVHFKDGRVFERYSQPQIMDGKIIGRVWSYRDVSEKIRQDNIIHEKNQILNRQNAELEKYIESNMQLENFAYLASHDLKTPLRNVINFSQLLKRSAKEKLNENELEFLNFIVSSSKSMNNLIEDLLLYSRINTQPQTIEKINLKQELNRIISEQESLINHKNADIFIGQLPDKIHADRKQIEQLFLSLILNGIKFSKPGQTPKISINGIDKDEYWLFQVRDEGIGIAPDYFDRIFLLFKKLHTIDQYEGTGIGLAMCKKIVERHNGTIWVDSTIGIGTTFNFTISKHLSVVEHNQLLGKSVFTDDKAVKN